MLSDAGGESLSTRRLLLSAQAHTNTLTTERELSTTPSSQVHTS